MATNEEMLRHVQMLAMGTLIAQLMAALFASAQNPDDVADAWRELMVKVSRQMTFPELPPAMSDAASQELEQCLRNYVRRARALATGAPLDRVPD
jgi:hypothetical protein